MTKYLLVAMVAACGGSSSDAPDRGLLVVDLTDAEVNAECTFLYDNYPSRTDDCGGGDTSMVGEVSIAECVKNVDTTIDEAPNCKLTVGEAEDCVADLYATHCPQNFPASCDPVFSQDCVGSASRTFVEQLIQRSVLSR